MANSYEKETAARLLMIAAQALEDGSNALRDAANNGEDMNLMRGTANSWREEITNALALLAAVDKLPR